MPAVPARKLLLYVEDDRINIILMEEACRALQDWVLDVAEDGAQALQYLANQPRLPDIVLIDMHLPDMSGLELLARMRSEPRLAQLRCIATSADDPPAIVQAALSAGFSEFWLKPVNPQQLEALARGPG